MSVPKIFIISSMFLKVELIGCNVLIWLVVFSYITFVMFDSTLFEV